MLETRWGRFRYWLGGLQGSLVYFGTAYALLALWYFTR